MLCFNLGIPLVEAGTNGYNANCSSIKKGKTQCYQCVEQIKEQSFPVCTIRQKPEKIIHCIVWAKALFEGLFGPKDSTGSGFIEGIIEELNEARNSDLLVFAQIIFLRLFLGEPEQLIKHN